MTTIPSKSPNVSNRHDEAHGAIVKPKLRGRAFYESIGSPKYVLAPMVNQSEFAWRMLTRSFLTPEENKKLLAYSPMLHAKNFAEAPKYREANFLPTKINLPSIPDTKHLTQLQEEDFHLDGNPKFDRPLFVQFCANSPDHLLAAAEHVQTFCDAVDLNLGCPQGIAKKGYYGAFLQESPDLIHQLITKLHIGLNVPVTAKIRILDTKEKTLEYAKMIQDAGASILTVHGRRREQKGHNTGLADWGMIKYLRENLDPETVMFANGNILQHEDLERCLRETGVDGVMSSEANLYDPTIFAEPPPIGQEGREYWRGKDGKGGFRMDAVLRRYLDILYRYIREVEPPKRKPLWVPSDPAITVSEIEKDGSDAEAGLPPRKKQKRAANKQQTKTSNASLSACQPHLFKLLRPLVSVHHNVRDKLAKFKGGDMAILEETLQMVEEVVKQGMLDYEKTANEEENVDETAVPSDPALSSQDAVARCKRPFFICQPYVRPLPAEAIEKGAMTLSKKDQDKMKLPHDTDVESPPKPTQDSEKPEPSRNSVGTVEEAAVYG